MLRHKIGSGQLLQTPGGLFFNEVVFSYMGMAAINPSCSGLLSNGVATHFPYLYLSHVFHTVCVT